ncbi:hypothetical protein [Acidovorax sp. Root275]|uniref:hypothetical protein n=1 Tax=Acidovorax sp. Root275 TaxID=1736508 RepID=UPI000AA237FE|nr:hypothetical protein [Acidovorax sp. Root275]
MKLIIFRGFLYMGAAGALLGCNPSSAPETLGAVRYPTDAQIASALEAQFASDRHSAAARDLIRTLGGDKGKLRYQIHQVIYRQGAYEARYDAVLVMGQPGVQSLQALYASMIPEAERTKLPQATLEVYETWLKQQAASLQKTSAPQAQALVSTLDLLGKCYRDKEAGAEVTVMQGLGALISPERKGLVAEKLALPDTTAHCLPA